MILGKGDYVWLSEDLGVSERPYSGGKLELVMEFFLTHNTRIFGKCGK
jgi:hypothetical protein